MDGQPFFLVNKEVDPGLIKVMEEEILPRLEREVPNQPTQKQLEEDPLLHRFSIIFDREGYSPEFFLRMKEKRIACMTYHKYPGEDWAEEEFIPHRIELSSGNAIEIKLAERGTFIGKKLWVREIRKLTDSGHQTSVLSTDYRSNLKVVAVAMFSRWSQENFLKYMRLHYNLDRLVEYSTEDIPETTKVINPEYRRIESEIKKKTAILNHRKAKFGAITLNDDIEPKKVHRYQQKKGELKEEINHLEKEIEPLKDKRKTIHKHITFAQLPEQERFSRLSTQSKYFVDTIKMIAYRAETAMVSILRETMSHPDEARSLLRGIYNTEADIIPDKEAGTLTVRLHQMANHCSSESTRHLCDELNATETVFPGTNLRLIYELVS
ncbi:MAG: hypothetical protein GY786_20675 [Proteobacteria bacterium]|nr:hypothetical protein [Pseudomonadota bacterium]